MAQKPLKAIVRTIAGTIVCRKSCGRVAGAIDRGEWKLLIVKKRISPRLPSFSIPDCRFPHLDLTLETSSGARQRKHLADMPQMVELFDAMVIIQPEGKARCRRARRFKMRRLRPA